MQQFCVEMMKRLDLQRRSDHFCDVVLEVGCGDDQARLKAHRIVLCAASPFFYNALNNDMKEKKEGVIRLENTSKAVMEELIDYLYTGHVDVTQHNAFDLLEMADFFVIPGLKETTSKFIARTLSSSNCLMAYYSAVKYNCTELHKEARDFICTHFMSVVEQEDFLNLSMKEVEDWISSNDIRVTGEEDLFQVILKWWEGKECHERERFFELFRHVRLVYMSRNYVFNAILPHPLIKNDETCTEFVLDAMKDLHLALRVVILSKHQETALRLGKIVLLSLEGKTQFVTFLQKTSGLNWQTKQRTEIYMLCVLLMVNFLSTMLVILQLRDLIQW